MALTWETLRRGKETDRSIPDAGRQWSIYHQVATARAVLADCETHYLRTSCGRRPEVSTLSWHVAAVNLDNLDELPKRCRRCVFWELSPTLAAQAEDFGTTELEKEAWVSEVLLEWGSCGKIVRVQGVPAGYVLYAPPSAVPRATEMPSGPVSADAVLLTTMQVVPEFSGEGLGRMLAQAVVKDLTRRGVKAVEAFGDAKPGSEPGCFIPADFLRRVGFKTVRPHPRYPRLRMELRSGIAWKEDVEHALEQLLGSVTIPVQATASVSRDVPART